MSKKLTDEPIVASFFTGELGWFLQRWQAHLRFLKMEKYNDKKFLLMIKPPFHTFVEDYVAWTIDLPKWFYDLKLETDCYDSPTPDAPPGSFTPPDVYKGLIEHIRQYYEPEGSIEIWPPRGCNSFWIDKKPQTYTKYTASEIKMNKPIICIFPRGRARAAFRNVPEYVWAGVVEALRQQFIVVLGGTPDGSCLANYQAPDVINLISYNGADKLDQLIAYTCNSVCTISSQSGLTHVSLLCGANTYIIGHEKDRHAVIENRLDAPVTFRYIQDYRAIDPQTILLDVQGFINALIQAGHLTPQLQKINQQVNRPMLQQFLGSDSEGLVGVEIGVYRGHNALNALENLNIKKLYLIDPYKDHVAGVTDPKRIEMIKNEAHMNLNKFGDKVVWLEMTAPEAVKHIQEKLDFAYVDGRHLYDPVKADIESMFPLMKPDGILGGHDYDAESDGNQVIRAVHDFFDPRGMKVLSALDPLDHRSHDWWVFMNGGEGRQIKQAVPLAEKDIDETIQADMKKLEELM